MRVAAIQTTPRPGLDANAVDHARLIGEAGARVCVFPELSLTGYRLDPGAALTEDDPRWSPIREACAAHDAFALVGAPLSTPAGTLIATVVIGPDGDTLGHYGKRHLHGPESDLFTPGGHHLLLEVDGLLLGLAICYDAAVPAHADEVSAGGADVYVVSALYATGAEGRIAQQMGRAASLGLWVVMAQFCGPTGGYDACGGSGVWRPGGEVDVRLGREPGNARATPARP
ncbi:carbon-nitrogen hydrolase family protein [Actinosynnema sp. NPDC023587]|uniref:carbon-nitrogen hydrolase family protein n=1 Tax=Actinosynnema sp. NPDC023587 TaxID=3154695 RepID=UPI0033EACF74